MVFASDIGNSLDKYNKIKREICGYFDIPFGCPYNFIVGIDFYWYISTPLGGLISTFDNHKKYLSAIEEVKKHEYLEPKSLFNKRFNIYMLDEELPRFKKVGNYHIASVVSHRNGGLLILDDEKCFKWKDVI